MEKYKAIVITPVKNSLENTLATIQSVKNSNNDFLYFVYDDFSDEEVSTTLRLNAIDLDYNYIHLSSLTNTPSPNYKIVLQDAQKKAIELQLDLIVVESDVEVKKETLTNLIAFKNSNPNTGMVGAVTVDHENQVNFPYLKFKSEKSEVINTNRSLSFCCTLLSNSYLHNFSFLDLDNSKDWYDTVISHKATELGFSNYVLMKDRVLHKPHGSRPWKQLKYTNPLKYYWLKLTKGRDKI